MSAQFTLEQVVSLAAKLPATLRLKLVAQICEQLLAEPIEESLQAVPQKDAHTFWQSPTLADLSHRQGLAEPQSFDQLLGAGATLWSDDAETEQFAADVRR
ncbi:MAG: hypothetical protein HYV60_18230, partial [Planctomycetia bacterium]|nr:hypothetical protein [Planctomycetia bacterium]